MKNKIYIFPNNLQEKNTFYHITEYAEYHINWFISYASGMVKKILLERIFPTVTINPSKLYICISQKTYKTHKATVFKN